MRISEQDRRWLQSRSREAGVSMAEIVRQSIRRMKSADQKSFRDLLAATSGLWRGGDGLRYQEKMRRDWHGRPF